MRKFIFGGIVISLIIPIIVNKICLYESPYPIVGGGEHWLVFFGSYLGGVLSSIIAFFIFYGTIQRTIKERKYDNLKSDINALATDLSNVISALNMDFLANLPENFILGGEGLSTIRDVQNKETLIKDSLNYFRLKYDCRYGKFLKYEEFVNEYKQVSNQLIDYSNKINKRFCEIKNKEVNNEMYANALDDISILMKYLMNRANENLFVYDKADDFIKSQYKELERLENTLNGEGTSSFFTKVGKAYNQYRNETR